MSGRLRFAWAALLVTIVVGCGGSDEPPSATATATAPVADCADLVAADSSPAQPLADLTLPCLADGEPVALDRLRGPAVVNLWASWCGPCRQELPVMQRLAQRAEGRVQVVGVVVSDRPAAAAALAEDLGVTFPAVEDRQDQLRPLIGARGVPATAFVDAEGNLRHVHDLPLEDAELAGLVAEHLEVTVE